LSPPPSRIAAGFVIKSGWTSVVLVSLDGKMPRVLDSRRVELCDPGDPASRQPYHLTFGTARPEGPELARLVGGVRRFGERAVRETLARYRSAGHALKGVAIVAGSLIDPATIGNEHIRIHAREGQLFREVVASAAAGARVPCTVWRERDLPPLAASVLGFSPERLRTTLVRLGVGAARPWRAEQKSAALAAWLVLSNVNAGAPGVGRRKSRVAQRG
jgi:hypothetical protein